MADRCEKTGTGNSYFKAETTKWNLQIRNAANESALRSLPSDDRFPVANWFRDQLFEIVKDAFRDSSREAVELLRPFQRRCSHALIIRDLHGSGWEDKGANELEESLKREMIESGWDHECCGAIVVEPEIEAWLRFDSSHLHRMIRDRARRRIEWEQLLLGPLIEAIIAKHGGKNSDGKPIEIWKRRIDQHINCSRRIHCGFLLTFAFDVSPGSL